MRFRLYREYGAMNSKPVFDAFEQGLIANGHQVTTGDSDVDVIWSILWKGRMQPNKGIYDAAKELNKPVIILEVGSLIRGTTWKVAINNINLLGEFGNNTNLNEDRPVKLNLKLKDLLTTREILIAAQNPDSMLWTTGCTMLDWVDKQIKNIREFTDRPIIVRPHPRYAFVIKNQPNVTMQLPKKVGNTYDDFDIRYNYACVVNYNSGPAIQAGLIGTTVICDKSSLAFPISHTYDNIENPVPINREEWLIKLAHTEWTIDEIAAGIPLQRLLPYL